MASIGTRRTEEVRFPSPESCQRQVQKILHSSSFRNASMLQQLLQYLSAKVYDHGAEILKEYTIGVEAFGRAHDFDPKTDTIVRVQIHRLRQKLKEYYDSDGVNDPVRIDIPKGHYLPAFECVETSDEGPVHGRTPERNVVLSNGHRAESSALFLHPDKSRPGRSFAIYVTIAIAAAIAVFAMGLWTGSTRLRAFASNQTVVPPAEMNPDKSSDPVKAFWTSFLGNDPTPVIAYPDAVFLLDDSNDLFRFRRGASDDRGALVDPHLAQQFASNPSLAAKAGQLYYENAYLGAGELRGVAMLANLFGQMGLKPLVKPSREITPEDLKQHNVIMLGSSFQNFAVAHLSTMGDFSFKNPDSRREQWRGMIVNSHPRPNEAAAYHTERDPNTRVLMMDYSLICVQPGEVAGRYIATLGGLDTTGTEGAILFATSRAGVEELTRVLYGSAQWGAKNGFPSFQALLRVRLEKGYEVLGASLVTVHKASSPSEMTDRRNSPMTVQ